MNRMYDVGNKARTGMYIAAPDEEAAMDFALRMGHARKKANLHITDLTDSLIEEPGVREILESDVTARLGMEIPAYSIQEVLQGVKKGSGRWKILTRLEEVL